MNSTPIELEPSPQTIEEQVAVDAFLKGFRAGQDTAQPETEEKYEVRCEIEFDIQCDKPVPENIVTKACYLSALRAAVGFGREQGLDYCDIECDLSDEYYRQVDAEEE